MNLSFPLTLLKQDHIHDINAFSRSRVLQVWLHLCREKAIPLPRQRSVMSLTLGRLQDKSSIVRKNAVQLLSEFLTSNPFAAKVSQPGSINIKLSSRKYRLRNAKQRNVWGTSHNNVKFLDFWLVTSFCQVILLCAKQVFVLTGFMKVSPCVLFFS